MQRGVEHLRQVGKLLAKMTGVVDEGADGLGIRYLGGLLRFRRELGWRPTLRRCRFRLRPRLGLDASGLGDGFVFRRLGLVDGLRRPVRGLVRIVFGEDIRSGVFEKGLLDERRDFRAGFLAIQGGAVAMGDSKVTSFITHSRSSTRERCSSRREGAMAASCRSMRW